MFEFNTTLTPELLARYHAISQQRLSRAASKAMGWRGEAMNFAVASMFALPIGLAFYALSTWTSHPADLASALIGFLAGGGMLLAALWHRSFEIRHLLSQDSNPALLPYHAVIDSEQLRFTSPRADTVVRWPFVSQITLHPGMVILWVEPHHGFIIPSSAFANDAAVQAFLTFARDHVLAEKSSGFTPARQPKP